VNASGGEVAELVRKQYREQCARKLRRSTQRGACRIARRFAEKKERRKDTEDRGAEKPRIRPPGERTNGSCDERIRAVT
jgi:hypothetical protein